MDIITELRVEALLPLTRLTKGHANMLGSAEGLEAVHESDAEVDLGSLSVHITVRDVFAK